MNVLYGSKSENCCGFCQLHHVGVTPNQLKKKRCMEPKQCKHFRKFPESEYWELEEDYQLRLEKRKEESKKNRAKRKVARKLYFENWEKQRAACSQRLPKQKTEIIRSSCGEIVASSESDIKTEGPFAILATYSFAGTA